VLEQLRSATYALEHTPPAAHKPVYNPTHWEDAGMKRYLSIAVVLCAVSAIIVAAQNKQPATGDDAVVRADRTGTLPKDIFPDSRNRLPLIKREGLDEHGRKAYDDAVAASNSGSGVPQGAAAIRLHGSGVDVRWASPLGRQLTELELF